MRCVIGNEGLSCDEVGMGLVCRMICGRMCECGGWLWCCWGSGCLYCGRIKTRRGYLVVNGV